MQHRPRTLCLFFLVAMAHGLLHAATLYVTPTGTDPNGAAWATPSSLVNALSICTASDEIWLAEGTYTNSATFTVPADCTLYGGFTNGMATRAERDWEAYPALLDGKDAARRVVTVTGADVILDGLVITNSYGNNAGGIYKNNVAGALTLANCAIVDNAAMLVNGVGCYFSGAGSVLMTNCLVAGNNIPDPPGTPYIGGKRGIGIYSYNTTMDIVDSVIRDQSAHMVDARGSAGSGLYFDRGTLRVLRTEFIGNRGVDNGGGGGAVYLYSYSTTTASFSNCVFRANITENYNASYGAAVWARLNSAKSAEFVNCTFTANTNVYGHGGAIYVTSGSVILKNSILSGNQVTKAGYLGHEIFVAGGSVQADYCSLSDTLAPYVVGAATLSHASTRDPLFASATDLHLQSASGRWENGSYVTTDTTHSPCIDVGDPADAFGDEPTDNGSRVNIGAYGGTAQASKSPSAAPQVANRGAGSFDYTRMSISGELVNASAVIAEVGICYGTNSIAGETTNGWDYVSQVYPPQQTGMVFSVTTPFLVTNTTYFYRCYATNHGLFMFWRLSQCRSTTHKVLDKSSALCFPILDEYYS